jgi:hypothetical protein
MERDQPPLHEDVRGAGDDGAVHVGPDGGGVRRGVDHHVQQLAYVLSWGGTVKDKDNGSCNL